MMKTEKRELTVMKKRLGSVLVISFLLAAVMLTACACGKPQVRPALAGQEKIIYNEAKIEAKYSDVEGLSDLRSTDMVSFCRIFSVPYYKYSEKSGLWYTAVNTEKGLTLFVSNYETSAHAEEKISYAFPIHFSQPQNEAAMKTVRIGMSLDMVRNADPDGLYPLPDAAEGEQKISYHYFENGNCRKIWYDENNIVSDITEFTI